MHQYSDPHLNLFRRFALAFGTQEYENNITHAFINTLRLSDPRVARAVLLEIVPELKDMDVDWTDIGLGLQRPPRSPNGYKNRVALGISVSGYVLHSNSDQTQTDQYSDTHTDDDEPEAITPEEQGRGIPDAWIYTKNSNNLCILIEVKTRGGIEPAQMERHIRTHFFGNEVTLKSFGIRWATLSHAFSRAYRNQPNPIIAEFLEFLSLEGLSATFRFDDATVKLAKCLTLNSSATS